MPPLSHIFFQKGLESTLPVFRKPAGKSLYIYKLVYLCILDSWFGSWRLDSTMVDSSSCYAFLVPINVEA